MRYLEFQMPVYLPEAQISNTEEPDQFPRERQDQPDAGGLRIRSNDVIARRRKLEHPLSPAIGKFGQAMKQENGRAAARMLYGMSREGWLPRRFARMNSRTQTPILATVLVSFAVLVLALVLPLVTLAKVTSFAMFAVLATISLALIRVKRAGPAAPGAYTGPARVHYASMISAIALPGLQAADLLR
jgi:hypothetical protein